MFAMSARGCGGDRVFVCVWLNILLVPVILLHVSSSVKIFCPEETKKRMRGAGTKLEERKGR